MGVFDLLTPVLDGIDWVLAFLLGPYLRLAIWAIVGAFASMFAYKWFSNQDAMAELKPQIKEAQDALADFDGDLDEIFPLLKRSLGLSMRQFRMALGPALLASIPLLFLLVWMSNRYDLVPPEAGDRVGVVVHNATENVRWAPRSAVSGPIEGTWYATWPEEGESLALHSMEGEPILELTHRAASPVKHKWVWWNALIANPAGYLDDSAPVEAVEFQIPTVTYLGFGPGWMRGWEFYYIGMLFAFSIAIKIGFRIH